MTAWAIVAAVILVYLLAAVALGKALGRRSDDA